MLTQEDLNAISALIKNEVSPIKNDVKSINQRLDNIESDIKEMKSDIVVMKSDIEEMKNDIEDLKENEEITRSVTNSIGEWIDYYFKDDRPYPVNLDENGKAII